MIYQPAEDSFLLEKYVKNFSRGKSFLDMGSGSGIQSKAAIKSGAERVLAVDISKEVVDNLKKENLNVTQSDLFDNIDEKFDIIAFNPPYLPEDKREDKKSQIATTGGKRGDEIILKFLKGASNYLTKSGFILLILSSHTPKDKIENILDSQNLDKKVLEKKKLFMEELELWKVTP